ncbi:MAG: DUF4136 domain-containing protein [Acidobacteria bacterium]|nr:DUF4136 domain-containing protein [Acidobacteriota bacterium]
MKSLKLVARALLLAVLAACIGYSVKYDFDPGANFKSYRSFDWYAASKAAKAKSQGQASPLVDKRVRLAVEQQLVAKGYRLETQGDPDFLVTYYPVFRNRQVRTRTTVGTGGWGWHRPWGYRVGARFTTAETHNYREGTIILEIVDFRTDQLVWHGAAQGALTGLDNPEEAQQQISQAVRDLLEKFPPR